MTGSESVHDDAAASEAVLRLMPSVKFGQLLRAQRSRRGMSQADLARELGVRPQTIGAWEADATPPQPRFHEKLAQFVGMRDVEELREAIRNERLPTTSVAVSDDHDLTADLEIRLNVSRRLASGQPLTADEIRIMRLVLGDA